MSDHTLPDQLHEWPDDPFELLGVDDETDLRTVRRAYTRLIRKFKPEQSPQHFRKIRDAYESIQQLFEWRSEASSYEEDDPPVMKTEFVARNQETVSHENQSAESADASGRRAPSGADPETEMANAWSLAEKGSLQEGYDQLQSLNRKYGPQHDLALRRYWLLKTEPGLDTACDRLDPLSEALSMSSLSGPASELYRRELIDNPDQAVDSRFSDLLTPEAHATALADLLPARWQAACRVGQPDLVVEDVSRFRSTISSESDEIWARLLLAAMNHLAWQHDDRSARHFDLYQQEIEAMEHVHFSLSYELDRLDLLGSILEGWKNMSQDPLSESSIHDLIRDSWCEPFRFWYEECQKFIHSVAGDPQQGLRRLDYVASIEPSLVVQVQSAVEQYQSEAGRYHYNEQEDADFRKQEAARFLRSSQWVEYHKMRSSILSYCIVKAISPLELVDLTADLRDCHELPDANDLSWYVQSDAPLQCVYQAWYTYWV